MSQTSGTRSSSRFWKRASTWRSGRRSEASAKRSQSPEARLAQAAESLVLKFDELTVAIKLLVGSHR